MANQEKEIKNEDNKALLSDQENVQTEKKTKQSMKEFLNENGVYHYPPTKKTKASEKKAREMRKRQEESNRQLRKELGLAENPQPNKKRPESKKNRVPEETKMPKNPQPNKTEVDGKDKKARTYQMLFRLAMVALIATDGYAVYQHMDHEKETGKLNTYLKDAVSNSKDNAYAVRCRYANSVYRTLKEQTKVDIVSATKSGIMTADKKYGARLPEYQRYVVARDLMRMAESYTKTGAPRQDFMDVIAAYSYSRMGNYVDENTPQTVVRGNINAYMKSFGALQQHTK